MISIFVYAIEGAMTVEYALNFEGTEAGLTSEPTVNLQFRVKKHSNIVASWR